MNKMSRLLVAAALPTLLCAGTAQAAFVSLSSNYGDADCFGLGGTCAPGDGYVTTLGGVFFADNRTAADIATAPITDIWQAGNRSWTHTYAMPGTPLVASFQFLIAGFADIGSVDLLIDGVVSATYTFAGQNDIVHSLSLAVPLSAIDGSTTFALSGPGGDGYILDSSRLTIRFETTDIPAPGTLLLAALALGGLAVSRRIKT